MAKYNLYIKQHVRMMTQERGVTYNRAYIFLAEEYALVEDSNGRTFTTQEEFKNAKNIGSESRPKLDNIPSSGGKVSESTHRKLFGTLGNNTE